MYVNDEAWRNLARRMVVEHLRLVQPAPAHDQIVLKEGEQHVTAPEQHGADFEEEEKERPQPERRGRWRRQSGRPEEKSSRNQRQRFAAPHSAGDHTPNAGRDSRAEEYDQLVDS